MGQAGAVIEQWPDLGITVISHWVFNCYVIHDGGDGRPLVVDAGLPSTALDVARVLDRLGAPDPPVVVATHLHVDHVAGLPSLVDGGASVVLPEQVRRWQQGARPLLPRPVDVAAIAPVLRDQPFAAWTLRELAGAAGTIGVDPRHGLRLPLDPDGWLVDGELVPGAPEWRVLSTGGHTDDSTSLWNERDGVLCSGDAVLAVGRRAWFNPELSDADATAATEARLRALPVQVLAPGHGRAVAGEVMAGAIAHTDVPPERRRGLLARLAGRSAHHAEHGG